MGGHIIRRMAGKIVKNKQYCVSTKARRRRALVLLSLVLLITITGCQVETRSTSEYIDPTTWSQPTIRVSDNVTAVILPHHLLVQSHIDKFYQELAAKNNYSRIVLLAPNHFSYGLGMIQSTDLINTEEKTIDYTSRQMLRTAPALEQAWITTLETARVLQISPRYFSREHGLFIHYPFIKKYFPEVSIVPIIIKRGTSQQALMQLGEELQSLINAERGRTLLLASLDFSHYTSEKWAVQQDQRMLHWLRKLDGDIEIPSPNLTEVLSMGEALDKQNSEAVAIDSPEVLYLLAWLMREQKAAWHFWARTSSASLLNGVPAQDNTSHIFGFFK